jgi:effector-binding domain-containing protein
VGAVTLVRTDAMPTAVIAEATTWEAFPSLWPALLDEVWAFVRQAGLEAGRNVMVYRDDVPHVEVVVEVGGPFAGEGRVVQSALPDGLAATTIAQGPPSLEGLGEAHAAVRAWCKGQGHDLEGTRWEIYGHWREEDPDSFETEVHWLVRHTGDRSGIRKASC